MEPSKCSATQKTEFCGVLLVLTINSLWILKRIGFSLWKYGNYRIPAIKNVRIWANRWGEPLNHTVLAHTQCSTCCHPSVTRVQLHLQWITSQGQQLAFQMVNFPNCYEGLKISMEGRWDAKKSFLSIYLLEEFLLTKLVLLSVSLGKIPTVTLQKPTKHHYVSCCSWKDFVDWAYNWHGLHAMAFCCAPSSRIAGNSCLTPLQTAWMESMCWFCSW